MLHLIMFVVLIGLADWTVQTIVPMTDHFKQIVHVIAVVATVLVVLQTTGLIGGVPIN